VPLFALPAFVPATRIYYYISLKLISSLSRIFFFHMLSARQVETYWIRFNNCYQAVISVPETGFVGLGDGDAVGDGDGDGETALFLANTT